MTHEEDIQIVTRYKNNSGSHPALARAYVVVMKWKASKMLSQTAQPDDDDIVEQMETAYRQTEQEKDAQAQMGKGE